MAFGVRRLAFGVWRSEFASSAFRARVLSLRHRSHNLERSPSCSIYQPTRRGTPNAKRQTPTTPPGARMPLYIFGWSFRSLPAEGAVRADFYSSQEFQDNREQIVYHS